LILQIAYFNYYEWFNTYRFSIVSMNNVPDKIASFLSGKRIAVAGVSRKGDAAANIVLKKLLSSNYEAIPVNPHAKEIEGQPCYASISAIPGTVDGVVIATHPDVSAEIVRQSHERGITQLWFHRSFGTGSVSEEAVEECARLGIDPIVGGCPLMFCEPVDMFHTMCRWWLQKKGRMPAATNE